MKARFQLTTLFSFLLIITSTAQTINTIAGAWYGDGQTAFDIGIVPTSQVADAAGNIYFTEEYRHVVRKLSANGVYSTLVGTAIQGYSGDGGPAATARLYSPYDIARDSAGNIYVPDAPTGRVRKISPNGIITTVAGNGTNGFSGDGGPATQAQLFGPNGVTVDRMGNLYIVDFQNARVRKVSTLGIITTVAGGGSGSIGSGNGGPATSAVLSYPLSVAVNKTGELFIADVGLNNVRKVGINGIITAFAGPVTGPGFGNGSFSGDGGQATAAFFNEITGVATDTAGNVFIADKSNQRVRKVNTSGIVTTIAGTGIAGFSGDGGLATAAQVSGLSKIGVDASGNLLITTTNRIRKISTTGIISTVAGNGFPGYNGNNTSVANTQLYLPQGLATDRQGNLYYADYENNFIRKITTGGIVTTVAGTGVSGFSGDGGPATAAQISYPYDVTVDTTGNIYFTDYANQRIRKINVNGIITTIGGTGIPGFSGDGGPATAARIAGAYGIAVDKTGNVFFCDRSNQRIRRIDVGGIITTVAGNGAYGFGGDGGPATAATFAYPSDLATDSVGNVLILDGGNSRVRKVNVATGLISTIAGNGAYTFNGGDGGPAINAAIATGSVAIDSIGNLFIGDYNGYIRKVNPAGIISTVAGGGTVYGDGGSPFAAQILDPAALAVDNQGNIYLTDRTNNRIRKITAPTCGTWTGNVSTTWENPQNWTCGQIPGSTSDVIIHSGTIRINSNVVLRSLRIDNGVNLTVATGYTLTVLQ